MFFRLLLTVLKKAGKLVIMRLLLKFQATTAFAHMLLCIVQSRQAMLQGLNLRWRLSSSFKQPFPSCKHSAALHDVIVALACSFALRRRLNAYTASFGDYVTISYDNTKRLCILYLQVSDITPLLSSSNSKTFSVAL